MAKIIGLLSTFEPAWGNDLQIKTDGAMKAAIDSICANRNSIAHGKNVGISIVQLKTWYEDAVKVIQIIESQCTS